MPSSSPESSMATLSVQDIAAFSDAELGQFMEKHRHPNGNFELPVDDWDKLSKDERDQLAERLKAQQRVLAKSPTACSRPLDLDTLDARLRGVANGNDTSLEDQRRSNTKASMTQYDNDLPEGYAYLLKTEQEALEFRAELDKQRREGEIKAYYDLCHDGGRPLYAIDLFEQGWENPDEYFDENLEEIIRPWKRRHGWRAYEYYWGGGGYKDPGHVFWEQLGRWRDFRTWQRDNRSLADDKMPKESWESNQALRDWQRTVFQWRSGGNFSHYAKEMQQRLERHNFTRPVQLHEDPKQQDQLTTWIEYIGFEYWQLDLYTSKMERLKPDYDKAWQELVDAKVLRPYETQEFLRTMESPMQRQAEKDQAKDAEKKARAEAAAVYWKTQKDPQRLRIPKAKRMSMLKAATAKLNAAKDRFASLKLRGDRITEFVRGGFGYDGAKNDAALQRRLLQWVLDQVPLIEAEVIQSRENEARSNEAKRTKRKRAVEGDSSESRKATKRKSRHQEQVPPSAVEAGTADTGLATDKNEVSGSKTGTYLARHLLSTSHAVSLGVRRSARIAARRGAVEVSNKRQKDPGPTVPDARYRRGRVQRRKGNR